VLTGTLTSVGPEALTDFDRVLAGVLTSTEGRLPLSPIALTEPVITQLPAGKTLEKTTAPDPEAIAFCAMVKYSCIGCLAEETDIIY
jgi:hypothetical protein